jgi:hypothetical protein
MQMEIYTAKQLIGIAIEKLKIYKSLGTNQISLELIQGGGETLYSKIHNFINSPCNEE